MAQTKPTPGQLVHYRRESDGTVQSVNADSLAHKQLVKSDDWEKVSKAEAERYEPHPFEPTSKRKAAAEQAKADAAAEAAAERAKAAAEAAEKAKA